jgi:hypothetical protein
MASIGLGLHQRDQFAHAVGGNRGMHRQQIVTVVGQRHRQQIDQRVIGHFFVDVRGDGEARQVAARDGVTIGHGLRGNVDAQHAAGAGTAVDHHLLAKIIAQLLRQNAAEDVGVRAGAVGEDVTYGTVRVVARRIRCCGARRRHSQTHG